MARRTGNNARGDINELHCAIAMLNHGIAVNALTASDTGWDLHCHVPEKLILDASSAGTKSWRLSGRTAHIQVKSAATDKLSIGTVRGWLTGTASGVPTLMFGRHHGQPVFSTPNDLSAWLRSANEKASSDDVKHKYTYAGRNTNEQTRLSFQRYRAHRFPSVLRLWCEHPQMAMEFPELTKWMNHEENASDPRSELVESFALAIWSDHGYGRQTEDSKFVSSLTALYMAAGFSNGEECAQESLTNGMVFDHTLRDEPVARDQVRISTALATIGNEPEKSAQEILELIRSLHETNASRVG